VGDWATWATAFVNLLTFGAVIFGLFVEGHRRKLDIARIERQRHEDSLSEQARLLGAYVKLGPFAPEPLPGRTRWIVVIGNASKLPIHSVRGELFDGDGNGLGGTPPCDLVEPESVKELPVQVPSTPKVGIRVTFRDDAGNLWRNGGIEGLELLEEAASMRRPESNS